MIKLQDYMSCKIKFQTKQITMIILASERTVREVSDNFVIPAAIRRVLALQTKCKI